MLCFEELSLRATVIPGPLDVHESPQPPRHSGRGVRRIGRVLSGDAQRRAVDVSNLLGGRLGRRHRGQWVGVAEVVPNLSVREVQDALAAAARLMSAGLVDGPVQDLYVGDVSPWTSRRVFSRRSTSCHVHAGDDRPRVHPHAVHHRQRNEDCVCCVQTTCDPPRGISPRTITNRRCARLDARGRCFRIRAFRVSSSSRPRLVTPSTREVRTRVHFGPSTSLHDWSRSPKGSAYLSYSRLDDDRNVHFPLRLVVRS